MHLVVDASLYKREVVDEVALFSGTKSFERVV